MRQAARAIIIENNKLLVMERQKYGNQYFTLIGGQQQDNETTEQALVREVQEETSLQVVAASLVFIEKHPAPYNDQYIYLCQVAPHNDVAIQDSSEEGHMNKFEANVHRPSWSTLEAFARLPFRTPQLQKAIVEACQKGFPKQPIKL